MCVFLLDLDVVFLQLNFWIDTEKTLALRQPAIDDSSILSSKLEHML